MGTKHLFYKDTIELEYEDKRHLYTVKKIDGADTNKKADGVTGVLQVIAKPALMYWGINTTIASLEASLKPGTVYDEVQIRTMLDSAKTAHRVKKEEAGNIGKMVHDWLDQHIKGQKPIPFVNEVMKTSCEKFLEWEKSNKVKFLENEKIVYSKRMNYAGTFDFLAEIEGKLWIGDIKTSSGIWDEYWFQTAAYHQAYCEEFGETKIKGEIIVRVGKDGTLDVKDTRDPYVTPYWINRNAFNHALGLHRTLNKLKSYKFAERNGNLK